MKIDGSTVLVTGGAGLIGSHLADALVEKGCQVRILDNLDSHTHPHGRPDWINPKAQFILGDVRDVNDLKGALQGCDYVFHQAAFGGFTDELSVYMDVNATGTARIFETIVREKIKVKKVLVASSQAIYGEGLYACPQHGEVTPPMRTRTQLESKRWEHRCSKCDSELKPLRVPETKAAHCETIYGISKYAQERMTLGLGARFGIPTVAMRYAVTYGPRQSIHNPYTGVVSIFSTQILNGRPPVIFEDGYQTRDMLFVKDNVSGNIFLAECDDAQFEVFNVATGATSTVRNIVDLLAEKYGSDLESYTPNEFRLGDVRHFVHSPERMNALGWRAEYSLSQGLDQYVDWIRSQGDLKDVFSKTHDSMRQSQLVLRATA